MSFKAIFPIAVAAGLVASSHAVVITVDAGINTAFAAATLPTPDVEQQITNTYSSGNPSPWLDQISVSAWGPTVNNQETRASASMDPSYIASSTGATYSLEMTTLAAQYGRAYISSSFSFSIDTDISFSIDGNLSGLIDGGQGGFAYIEGRLEYLSNSTSITEIEEETDIPGAFDFSIGDGVAQSAMPRLDGPLSGTLLAGSYRLYLEHELVDNSGLDGSTAGGALTLVLGDGGNVVTPPVEVPDGGATALLAGFSFFGLRVLKSKKRK